MLNFYSFLFWCRFECMCNCYFLSVLLSHTIFLLSHGICLLFAFVHMYISIQYTTLYPHTIFWFKSWESSFIFRSTSKFSSCRFALLSVWQIFIMYIFIITEETVNCAASVCAYVFVCKLAPLSSVCDGDWTIRKIIIITKKERKKWKEKTTKNWIEITVNDQVCCVLLFVRPAISIVSEICK